MKTNVGYGSGTANPCKVRRPPAKRYHDGMCCECHQMKRLNAAYEEGK